MFYVIYLLYLGEIYRYKKITGNCGEEITTKDARDMHECITICLQYEDSPRICGMVNYNFVHGDCHLFEAEDHKFADHNDFDSWGKFFTP